MLFFRQDSKTEPMRKSELKAILAKCHQEIFGKKCVPLNKITKKIPKH